MKRVGRPHGLFYYYHYPMWKTFFLDIGADVVTSAETNRFLIEQGIEAAVDEICFPMKVYLGHIKDLCNCKLDYIFLPRIVSIEKRSYICPKFMGVPDMVKAAIPDLPTVIDTLVDFSKGNRLVKQEIRKTGRIFTSNIKVIDRAYKHAFEELTICKKLTNEGYTMAEAIKIWEGDKQDIKNDNDLNIGVLGHGYALYDESISMNIINRLRALGCKVHLPESLDKQSIEQEAATMPKRIFWTLGRKMVGSALYMSKRDDIDGIIYVACFGCGPDSLIGEIIERKVRNKAFMLMTIDEHTGEGGLVTRLEAFCDMLRRRRRCGNESNISSHG